MLNTRHIRIIFMLAAALLTGCEEPPPEEPIRPVLAAKVGDVEGFQRDRFPGRANNGIHLRKKAIHLREFN